MRLHTIELTGFGPFRQTQRVDFDAFSDDGVFLISGRTGTGKSSILDGVSFALYGVVPRYDGAEKRLRSDHCAATDPTEVRLEFTVGDGRWRVMRAPEYDRPAKRGGGLTTAPARAQLDEFVDGVWVGRAAKPRDVGVALSELLGLNAQQFQQVILLAQNKFSRFLLAPGDERQTLLRTLFGTRRFDEYREALDVRRRELKERARAVSDHTCTLLDIAERLVDAPAPSAETAARREALQAAQSRADDRVARSLLDREAADAASEAAATRHAALVDRAQRARERALLRERLEALERRAPEIAAQRARLSRGRAADALSDVLDAADRARADHERAVTVADTALAEWTAAGGDADVDAVARVDELTASLARWADALERERALDRLDAQLVAQQAAVDHTDAALEALDEQRALAPAQRAELEVEISGAHAQSARRDDLHARVAEIAAQQAAARDAVALAAEASDADRAHLDAAAEAAEAATAVTALLQRRLAGFAGELSAALVDGQPCGVCGSTVHPHPADVSDDHVTDDDLAAAERRREAAHAAASAAAAVARDVHERRNAADVRAGGHDIAALDAAMSQARADADDADAAWTRLETLRARRAELDDRSAKAEAERTMLAARRDLERTARATTAEQIAQAESVIAAARGDHTTVAERVRAGETDRARARALVESRAAVDETRRAWDAARTARDERLADTEFADAEAARAALLPHGEAAQLDAQLVEYAADVHATQTRLHDLDAVPRDAEPSDAEPSDAVPRDAEPSDAVLEASEAAVDAADRARAQAIATAREAHLEAARLRELREQIDVAWADAAEVLTEAESVARLADTVAGRAPNTMKMDLETFVLAAELEAIVAAANLRLAEMSSGRYTLHHSDARAARGRASGLGIAVLDAHTGRLRSAQSLSGGETFLASLALALGLGEVVTSRAGGIRLDTLFVDEGFGSLDPETLDLAMRTLDELRAGGRTVGVISHVEAMKEQLPAQLVVEATAAGPSVICQEAATPGR